MVSSEVKFWSILFAAVPVLAIVLGGAMALNW